MFRCLMPLRLKSSSSMAPTYLGTLSRLLS